MLEFILLLVLIITIIYMSTVIVLFKSYKSYKQTYKALINREYVYSWSLKDTYYFNKPSDFYLKKTNPLLFYKLDDIIFFNDGSIKLIGYSNYLHNAPYTYWDPYSLYWMIKLNNWFKKNKHLCIDNSDWIGSTTETKKIIKHK